MIKTITVQFVTNTDTVWISDVETGEFNGITGDDAIVFWAMLQDKIMDKTWNKPGDGLKGRTPGLLF